MGLTHPHQLYHRHTSETAAGHLILDIGVCAVLVELIQLVIFSELIHDLLALWAKDFSRAIGPPSPEIEHAFHPAIHKCQNQMSKIICLRVVSHRLQLQWHAGVFRADVQSLN